VLGAFGFGGAVAVGAIGPTRLVKSIRSAMILPLCGWVRDKGAIPCNKNLSDNIRCAITLWLAGECFCSGAISSVAK